MGLETTSENSLELAWMSSSADFSIPYQLESFENSGLQDTIVNVKDPLQTTILQDTLVKAKDTVPPKPTFAQIRYWRWQREKKLVVGDSRYVQPIEETNLVSSVTVEKVELSLPIRERNFANTDWLTLILLLGAVLIASVRYTYSKYIGSLFLSLVNYSTSFRMFREKNYPVFHGAFRLEFLFYITFPIFLYQVVQHFELTLVHKSLSFYMSGFLIVIAYFFGKKIVYSAIGSIIESNPETQEYLFNIDNVNRIMGLVLFPVVALINYYPANNPVFMVSVGIFVVGIFYILLLQRGISILLRKQFSIFYLFLYLCTLEFVPLLLIFKVVVL